MKIVCIGGGPAGLYFGLLMKQQDPSHDVTVVERNKPYDTFGWGVVFSDQTMDNMRREDPVTAAQIQQAFTHCARSCSTSCRRAARNSASSWSSRPRCSATRTSPTPT